MNAVCQVLPDSKIFVIQIFGPRELNPIRADRSAGSGAQPLHFPNIPALMHLMNELVRVEESIGYSETGADVTTKIGNVTIRAYPCIPPSVSPC